jgi:fluoride exporter
VARLSAPLRAGPAVVGVIAAGGALGALARYGLAVLWPHHTGQFPWATFVTNGAGCLLIGVLMGLIGTVWARTRLVRPFLGVGVLGGFTTFSTYAVDGQTATQAGHAGTALLYLMASLAVGFIATFCGLAVTERLVRR